MGFARALIMGFGFEGAVQLRSKVVEIVAENVSLG